MDKKVTNVEDLAKQVDKDLKVLLPHIVKRMKKRLLLAYLLGVQDGKDEQKPPKA